VHHELGGAARAIGAGHQHQVLELLGITAFHMGQERAERILADLSRTLVHIVRHVFAQAGQHAFPVARVEGGVITIQQGKRGGLAHRWRLLCSGRLTDRAGLVSAVCGSATQWLAERLALARYLG